jgi:methionyl-tRNA synthetase
MRHLITAALPYANGPLHIGHLSGAYLTADIYARFLRLRGEDVIFVCGSDEHGAAITIRAKKEGITPQAIVDKYHENIRTTFERLGVAFDIYHRTSDAVHHGMAQDFFRTLDANGDFDQRETEQYFDETYQQFLADRYIIGTCPKCANENAYGDQCEKCGSALSPTELLNPRSTMSGATPVLKPTTHWYFLQNKYADFLREWTSEGKINGVPHHDATEWKKFVLGQCRSWLDFGDLLPRAITRDLDWGVKVPAPPLPSPEGREKDGILSADALPAASPPREGQGEAVEGKVLYVWFDAPIGYISATKALGIERHKDPEWWRNYWQKDDTKLVHFIGKDNIVFHCIIFPAMLQAHGGYVLPTNVPANQFLNLEGDKISTSRNHAVWAHEYLDDFEPHLPNAADTLRYVMIKTMPESKDTDFTWAHFKDVNDSELVGTLANSVNRVVTLINKYYDGKVPAYTGGNLDASAFSSSVLEQVRAIETHIKAYSFRDALTEMLQLSRLIDGTLQTHEPWKKYKAEPDSAFIKDVLYVCLQAVAALSVTVQPFLPKTADKLRHILGLEPLENGDWSVLVEILEKNQPIIAEGHQINAPEHLFTRIDDSLIQKQLEKLAEAKKLNEKENEKNTANANLNHSKMENQTDNTAAETAVADAPKAAFLAQKFQVEYEDFDKIDLRTGVITAAEKVRKMDKLLQLTVDLGYETRTLVSGIALHFAPEDIVGQQVVVLANLAPRTIGKIESNGMILMASDAEGKLSFVSAQQAGLGGGWVVR